MKPKVLTYVSPSQRRWRWARRLALVVGLLVVLVAGWLLLLYFLAQREWREAVAEADRLDPGWRFEELQAKRAEVAGEDNAALCVLAALKVLPRSWPEWGDGQFANWSVLQKSIEELPPNIKLTAQHVEAMNEAWADAAESVAEARKLRDLPRGRYPMSRDAEGLPTSRPAIPAADRVARLLGYDALLRAHEEDVDAALESCRGMVNVARSFGDEPFHLSQQTRLELRGNAFRIIERVLAQGQASEAELAALQKLLEDEEPHPVFLHGARGLRAWLDEFLEAMADGRARQAQLPVLNSAFAINVRPSTLHMTTRLVEVARLPVEKQTQALEQGGSAKNDEGPYLGRIYMVPKIQYSEYHLSRDQIRTQAELRCAIVAIAAERYRLAQDKWPGSPAALVPAYLGAVPTDPFDGQPVRYRLHADGLVIYCLGPDRTDDQGKLDRGIGAPAGTDLGIRLWDIAHRRQRFRVEIAEFWRTPLRTVCERFRPTIGLGITSQASCACQRTRRSSACS